MAQIGKIEVKMEIKSSLDKFYGLFRNNMSILSSIAPENIKSIQVVEVDEDSVGCVMSCHLILQGIPITIKYKIEAADDENKTIVFSFVGGVVMQTYKSMKVILELNKDVNGVGYAKVMVEFEKSFEEGPNYPHLFAEFCPAVCKLVDAYLMN